MKKQPLLLLLLCLLLPMSQIVRATESLPSVESFFNDPFISQAALSPEGKHLAVVMRDANNVQVVVVLDTTDLTKRTQAAVAPDASDKILAVHWVNENRLVFSVKYAKLEFAGMTDLFAADPDGSNQVRLINGDWHHHQQNVDSNVKDKTLTPDYSYFSATHDGSDDIIVVIFRFDNALYGITNTHLFRLNTKTRKLSELDNSTQPAHVTNWLLDKNDVPRVAYSHVQGTCASFYRAADADHWIQIAKEDCYHDGSFIPLSIDFNNNLIVKKSYNGFAALFNFDVSKMKIDNEPFFAVGGFDFIGSPEVDRIANKVIGIHYESDAKSTVWLEPKFKEYQQKVDQQLTSTANQITCGADCLNAPTLLVVAQSDRQPIQYFLYTTATNKLIGLGGQHPDIKPAQMGTRDFAHYIARDGRSIPTYITLPPGKAAGPMPAIVLVHGGPAVRDTSWEWQREAQFLASRGYVVIQPQFRGGAGFGYDHFQAGFKEWGLTMQDDLADAAQWAIQKGWADPKRIAIMGASYGGYATLMGLIKNPELFRCGVEWAGVADLGLMFKTPQDDDTVDGITYDLKTLIGDPDVDVERFKQTSPLENAAKLTQPLLMAHGGMDRRVPIVHATDFYSAVHKHNDNVEWIVYADEGHGWYHEKNNIDFWTHVEKFLDKNLKNVQ